MVENKVPMCNKHGTRKRKVESTWVCPRCVRDTTEKERRGKCKRCGKQNIFSSSLELWVCPDGHNAAGASLLNNVPGEFLPDGKRRIIVGDRRNKKSGGVNLSGAAEAAQKVRSRAGSAGKNVLRVGVGLARQAKRTNDTVLKYAGIVLAIMTLIALLMFLNVVGALDDIKLPWSNNAKDAEPTAVSADDGVANPTLTVEPTATIELTPTPRPDDDDVWKKKYFEKVTRTDLEFFRGRLLDVDSDQIWKDAVQILADAREKIGRYIEEDGGDVGTEDVEIKRAILGKTMEVYDRLHMFLIAAGMGDRQADWVTAREHADAMDSLCQELYGLYAMLGHSVNRLDGDWVEVLAYLQENATPPTATPRPYVAPAAKPAATAVPPTATPSAEKASYRWLISDSKWLSYAEGVALTLQFLEPYDFSAAKVDQSAFVVDVMSTANSQGGVIEPVIRPLAEKRGVGFVQPTPSPVPTSSTAHKVTPWVAPTRTPTPEPGTPAENAHVVPWSISGSDDSETCQTCATPSTDIVDMVESTVPEFVLPGERQVHEELARQEIRVWLSFTTLDESDRALAESASINSARRFHNGNVWSAYQGIMGTFYSGQPITQDGR